MKPVIMCFLLKMVPLSPRAPMNESPAEPGLSRAYSGLLTLESLKGHFLRFKI